VEPVFFAPSIGYWVATRYADVKAILSDPETFSAAIALAPLVPLARETMTVLKDGLRSTPVLVDLDPPGHARIRRRVADALSVRRMNLLRPTIFCRASDLIDRFAATEPADLVAELTFPLPALTIFALVGFPDADAQAIKGWCADKLELTWGRPLPDYQLRAAKSMAAFWEYCEHFVQLRKREPGDDLISELLAQRGTDPEALDDRELASLVFALSFAGHETTSNLLTNALRQLLSPAHAGMWQELCADPTLIPGAIEETLRFDTPAISWRRMTTRETMVGGVPIPAGSKLLLAFAATNRDPQQFPNPDVFDIRRQNAHQQLSFGWGMHFCLGAGLARIEAEIALRLLCERFADLRLVRDQELSFPATVTLRGPRELRVEWSVAQHPFG
jgi:cytochrome P450